jgi:3D (Asp-Asp-Asp) domain-containing protein
MNDSEYLNWERQMYERRKTRNEQRRARRRYRLFFAASVALWLILAIALLTIPARSKDAPEALQEPIQAPIQEPADDGRLPGDDVPATEYASLEAMPETEYLGEFTMTHYCPCERCCGQWADGITATGTVATQGRTIAVDPAVIPYGSEVEIQYEDGTVERYVAEDCGAAIKENRIDVFMNSHDEALNMGIRKGSVYLVVEVVE